MSVRSSQVLVAGAGPVGLMLAIELRRHGADVAVLEERSEPTGESRASQLNARTMEIFDERELLDGVQDAPRELMGHFGGLPLDVSHVESPFAGLWKVPQFQTEAVLTERALELGVGLYRSCRVDRLQPGTGATDELVVLVEGRQGLQRWHCEYLVGCDGESSRVRELAGIEFAGSDARRKLYRADVEGLSVPDRRFERLPAGLAVAARRPDGVTRVMVHEYGRDAVTQQPGRPPAYEDVAAAWYRVTGEDITGGIPLWVDLFSDAIRLATRYRAGRILLAGDAAHRQMPIGGQSINLGLQDAVNLGWKLASQVHGTSSSGLLDSYHSERHPIAAGVQLGVDAQALLQFGGPEVIPMRAVLAELLRSVAARDQITAELSGIAVRYPALGSDAPAPSPELLGSRVPHEVLHTEHGSLPIAHLLRDAAGLLLDLSDPLTRRGRSAAIVHGPWANRVRLVSGRVTADALAAWDLVLVRPDGHIAALARGDEDSGLWPALARWFGAPAHESFPGPALATAQGRST